MPPPSRSPANAERRPKPLAAFRARFRTKSPAYVTVRVFSTAAALRAYTEATYPNAPPGIYFGLAMTWTRRVHDYGEILLSLQHLSAEVLAHECAHIALGYADRNSLTLQPRALGQATRAEEEFCSALGGLLAHVVAGLKAAGLRT